MIKRYIETMDPKNQKYCLSEITDPLNMDHDFITETLMLRDLESNLTYDRSLFPFGQCLHDIIWPQKIILSTERELEPELDDVEFSIELGPMIIRIPLDFLVEMFPPQIIDSKYHILIPKAFFFKQHIIGYYGTLRGTLKGPRIGMNQRDWRYIDMMNRNNLHGIPLRSMCYYQLKFSMRSPHQKKIKYDLGFEITELKHGPRDIMFMHTMEYNVDLIHKFDTVVPRIIRGMDRENWIGQEPCACMPPQYIRWFRTDLTFLLSDICTRMMDHGAKKIIDIRKYGSETRSMLVENNTKMIGPLCQIINQYVGENSVINVRECEQLHENSSQDLSDDYSDHSDEISSEELLFDSLIRIESSEHSSEKTYEYSLCDRSPDSYAYIKNKDTVVIYMFINNSLMGHKGDIIMYKKCS